jgi:anti-sigma28 factor (negative regulator of flagellin synthesis)
MDAVRNELRTGKPTKGKFHDSKLEQCARGLKNRINNGVLNFSEESIAKRLLQDILNALSGK